MINYREGSTLNRHFKVMDNFCHAVRSPKPAFVQRIVDINRENEVCTEMYGTCQTTFSLLDHVTTQLTPAACLVRHTNAVQSKGFH